MSSLRAEQRPYIFSVALLSLGAAYIHTVFISSHLAEWWLYGVFFILAANAQLLFAVMVVWRPYSWLPLAGIVGNLPITGMYVLTRTAGVPIGPHARTAESVGLVDWGVTAAQVAIILLLLPLLTERLRMWMINVLLLLGVGTWVLWLSGNLTP